MALSGSFLRTLQRRLHRETHQDRDRIPFAYATSPIRNRGLLPQRLQRGLVSRMLGHANAATTMRYIGIVSDEMRNAVESATQTGMGITMKGNPVVGTPDVNYTLKHVVIG